MQIIKRLFGSLSIDFTKRLNPDHKILDDLTSYAINYFKDKVEPNKKFKKPNSIEKKALNNLVKKLSEIDQGLSRKFKQTFIL